MGRGASSIPIRQPTPNEILRPAGSTKIVDLGLIDFATVFTEGPQTLYTMAGGEFLRAIKWTDTDFQAFVPAARIPGNPYPLGFVVSTLKGFGWTGFTGLKEPLQVLDTDAIASGGKGYGPDLEEFASMLVLSAGPGPIQASVSWVNTEHGDSGFRVAGIIPWAAKTHYDVIPVGEEKGSETPQRVAVIANGTVWINEGEGAKAGESGIAEPEFAAHAGGEIADGANIVWKDSETAPITAGKQHAVAEIWTP